MRDDHDITGLEAEQLLYPENNEMNEMADLNLRQGSLSRTETGFTVDEHSRREFSGADTPEILLMAGERNGGHVVYQVYKRRWFGLMQLVLLNIVVSWDVRSVTTQFFSIDKLN